MRWMEIMKIENPNQALIAIYEKVDSEMLSLQEMEDMVEMYAEIHGIIVDEMAYYPNGDNVIFAPNYEPKQAGCLLLRRRPAPRI